MLFRSATGALMERFYGYLKAGQPKDAALRAAQLDLIRKAPSVQDAGVDTAPPFFWAAFQLYGDWR